MAVDQCLSGMSSWSSPNLFHVTNHLSIESPRSSDSMGSDEFYEDLQEKWTKYYLKRHPNISKLLFFILKNTPSSSFFDGLSFFS